MTKYRKHTKIAEQEQQQEQEQQFSNFLGRARYSHGQKVHLITYSCSGFPNKNLE